MSEKPTADWGADSHSGSRIVNEDFIAFTRYDDETEIAQKGICLVVTDGSSSARCGQRAAQLAAFKVLESYYSQQTSPDPKTALRFGLQSALSLLEYESAQTKCDGMSVSVAAAAIYDGQMHVAWVGNARAYVLRNGHINTLTTPDIINPSSPFLLGPAQGILESTTPVEGGDRIILCTDGIYQVLNDEAIATLATSPQRPEDAAHALIQGALAQHTHDNASAIVFDNGKALVKHTPKPVAPLRRPGFQIVPVVAATLGIILFVAGSATLLSRRTRSTLSAIPAAPTEVQQVVVESAPIVAEAIDPSAGQPTAQEPTSEAAAILATNEPLPSETPLPAPTITPPPLPTATEAVVQATREITRAGMQIRVQSESVSSPTAIVVRPSPTRLLPTRIPPTLAPTRALPTATRIPPTRAISTPTRIAPTRAAPTVGPTPTRRRPRPTATVIPIQPTAAPIEPTARPTDVPKPQDPPPPQPTSPPPPTARPTDPPPPPPTDLPPPPPTDPPPPPPTDPPPPPTKAPPPPPADVQAP